VLFAVLNEPFGNFELVEAIDRAGNLGMDGCNVYMWAFLQSDRQGAERKV